MSSLDTKIVTLKVEYDTDCESPLEYDGMWTLHRFEGGWYGKGPTEFFSNRGDAHTDKWLPDTLDLFFKLRNGLAWTVGGYFDGGSQGISVYVQEYDPEDKIAGLLVWEHKTDEMGAKTKEERKKDAQSTLDIYEKWANGECYGYILNDDQPDEDSCWGFVGEEHLLESLKHDYLPDERPLIVVLANDQTESIVGSFDFGEGVETMDRREYRAFLRAEDEDEADDLHDYDNLEVCA